MLQNFFFLPISCDKINSYCEHVFAFISIAVGDEGLMDHLELKSGDEQDQQTLLNDLYKQMFAVAYAKTRNKQDALDIVQESWVKILQKIDSLKDREKLFQWAKAIVSNTANTHIKKNAALRASQTITEEVATIDIPIDAKIEERILVEAILECIEQLDDLTRRMFVYKYYYEWKDRQIAERLSLPEGTVKARLSRGKSRVRKIMEDNYRYS